MKFGISKKKINVGVRCTVPLQVDAEPQLLQLIRVYRGRCFREGACPAGGFGKCDDFSDGIDPGHNGHKAIKSESHTAVGRGAMFQGINQKSEF